MSRFLHGWRRKIGVVALVMACVFAAGWVRSLFVSDKIEFPVGRHTTLVIESTATDFGVGTERQSFGFGVSLDDEGELTWPFTSLGISLPHGITLSYWVVVMPLTLLSAYLLFSKPPPPKLPDKLS